MGALLLLEMMGYTGQVACLAKGRVILKDIVMEGFWMTGISFSSTILHNSDIACFSFKEFPRQLLRIIG